MYAYVSANKVELVGNRFDEERSLKRDLLSMVFFIKLIQELAVVKREVKVRFPVLLFIYTTTLIEPLSGPRYSNPLSYSFPQTFRLKETQQR